MTRTIFGRLFLIIGLAFVLNACGDDDASGVTAVAQKEETSSSAEQPAEPNAKQPPLKTEEMGRVETLPADYPEHWFLVFDLAFFHMLEGRTIVVDALGKSIPEQFKGSFNVSFGGSIARSDLRNELYAAETFYTRGNRGTRTDVVTIYDTATLEPVDEIVWPKPKRYNGMPQRYALTLIDNDRLLLAFNLDPATSVTVFDVEARKVLNEVATPGCSLIYPTGERGFTSICSNGGLMSTQLKADGTIAEQTRVKPFFSSDTSPIFERAAVIDGMAYFPSFDGRLHPINLKGNVARVGEAWHLVPEAERGENWRPGGIGMIDKDSNGRFYILMHPDGGDGTHNAGGTEVWVFDPAAKKRVSRIELANWGLSIAVGGGEEPLMMVTNETMALDVYRVASGEHLRTIDGIGQETPLMLHGIK
ncbi:MAG: amine dehydrogenase large subunit [Gammaproteobacteria bacterium]